MSDEKMEGQSEEVEGTGVPAERVHVPAEPKHCPECGHKFIYEKVEEAVDAGRPLHIEIDESENGLAYFRFRAANGNKLCHSETYIDDRTPVETIQSIITDIQANNFSIVDLRKNSDKKAE